MSDKPKLLDQVRNSLRQRNYSYRTEQAYIGWIKRYILFHKKRHPKDMGEEEIGEYLYLGLSLSSIRIILNPQLEIPISYPSYRYFVRQNAKLLELWQTKKGKGWISTVYLRTKMGDTHNSTTRSRHLTSVMYKRAKTLRSIYLFASTTKINKSTACSILFFPLRKDLPFLRTRSVNASTVMSALSPIPFVSICSTR